MSYTFSIKKNEVIPLVEITIDEKIFEKNLLIPSLLEKCFERVFQIIRENAEKNMEYLDLDHEEEDDSD